MTDQVVRFHDGWYAMVGGHRFGPWPLREYALAGLATEQRRLDAKLKGEDPNKKACLFQNGLRDLAECGEALEEDGIGDLHGDELRCAIKLIQMCRDIAEQFEGVDIEALWNPPEKKPPAASVAERRRQQKLKEA